MSSRKAVETVAIETDHRAKVYHGRTVIEGTIKKYQTIHYGLKSKYDSRGYRALNIATTCC